MQNMIQLNLSWSDVFLVSPLIALFLTSLIPITIKVLKGNVEQNPLMTLVQALLGIVAAGFLLAVVSEAGKTAFYDTLVLDGLTLWAGIIALVATAGAIVMMYENPATNGKQFSEFVFLTLSSALGMIILICAVDLLTLFVGLELMSLPLYLMIAMSNEQKIAKESAIKYFVLGSFASAILLYGIALTLGSAGHINILALMDTASSLMATNKIFLFGMAFITVGFCFKVSIAPMHAWTPDVYQGSPTPITSLMATAVKAVSFAAFLRLAATKNLIGSQNLFEVLQWLAVLTMLVGKVAAIIQNNMKRMLAYSSIAHSGYLLVGVITVGIAENSAYSATGVVFYLLGYGLMTIGAFALVAMLERDENSNISVDDMAGLSKSRPVLSLCMTIFLLSMAGLPPTLGFFGKFYLFSAAVQEGLMWMAFWGVINSVISAYYYLRPIVVMYMKDGDAVTAPRSLNATAVTIFVCAILTVVFGILSGPLFQTIEKSF